MTDVSSDVLQQRPWHTTQDRCTDAPWGLLGMGEGHLLYYLARDYYRGEGTIVDAGAFLGRSAWFLAKGLEANGRVRDSSRPVIHCFDNFVVNDALTTRHIEQQFGVTMPLGASTRDMFDRATQPVATWLNVHEGDFHTCAWATRPIEILFVDIAKLPTLHRRLVEVMFPGLIPGRSVVVHQDYHHPWLPYIHVAMEYLHEYFELVEPKIDDSAVFLCTRPIPKDALRIAAGIDELPFEERLALMDRAIARLPADGRQHVELARVNLIGRERGFEAARTAAHAIDVRGLSGDEARSWQTSCAEVLQEFLFGYGWQLVAMGRIAEAMDVAATVSADDPRYPDALVLSAHCLRREGRLREAADALQLATARWPDNPAVWIEQAWLDLARQHRSAALAAARRAVAGIPARPDQEPHALHALAAALSALGEHEEALAANARALAQLPGDQGILHQRTLCLARQASGRAQTDLPESSVRAAAERALDSQDMGEAMRDTVRQYLIDLVTSQFSRDAPDPPQPVVSADDLRAWCDAAYLFHVASTRPDHHRALRQRLDVLLGALTTSHGDTLIRVVRHTILADVYVFLAFASDEEFSRVIAR